MSTQLVSVDQRANDVKQLFKLNSEAMIRQAPKTTGDPQRLLRIAYNAIAYDDKLVQCSRQSLIGGVMEALKLGITLGGPMQEGWLLPFRSGGGMTATLIVGYQGYRNIIDRGRSVIDLHPRAVYEGDEFDVDFGSMPTRIKHKPYFLRGENKGKLLVVYAIARLRGGGVQVEVMPRDEVDLHRARSRAKDSGPWVTDYDAMALKTVVRKIAKYLPKSSELLSRALDLDDKADRGVDQEFDVEGFVIPPESTTPTTTPAADALKARLRDTPPSTEAEPSGDGAGQ